MSAIENNTKTASYDEIATLIENATAISVGPCSCRRSRRLMGEGCGHLEEDMCCLLYSSRISTRSGSPVRAAGSHFESIYGAISS